MKRCTLRPSRLGSTRLSKLLDIKLDIVLVVVASLAIGCQDTSVSPAAMKPAASPAPTSPLIGQPPRPEHRADLNCDVRVNFNDFEIITHLVAGEGDIVPFLNLDGCNQSTCHFELRANLDPHDLDYTCWCWCEGSVQLVEGPVLHDYQTVFHRPVTLRDYGRWQREASRGWQLLPADE